MDLFYIKTTKPFGFSILSEKAYTSKDAAIVDSQRIEKISIMDRNDVYIMDDYEEITNNRVIFGRTVFEVDNTKPHEARKKIALDKLNDKDKKVLGLS